MLTKKTFGLLTVIEQVGKQKRWLCRCSCGTVKTVKQSKLESGHTKSCGCARSLHLPRMTASAANANRKLAIGMQFGRLIIVSCYPTVAVCACGTKKTVIRHSLLFSGHTRSCGCLQLDVVRAGALSRVKAHRMARGFGPNESILSANSEMRNVFKRTIAPKILARDDYTCLLCGERGKVLNVHHIVPWSESKDLRMEHSNLATLCRACHVKVAHQGNVHGPVCPRTQAKLRMTILDRDTNAAKNILALGAERPVGGILAL